MSTEEQEMLARISQLAGQINRRKNQQAGLVPSDQHQQPHPQHRTVSAPARFQTDQHINNLQEAHRYRGGGHFQHRGYRVGKPAPHRHRTLVLNGASSQQPGKSDVDSDASGSSWVTKTDRHMQLINTNIYEKESQARLKAIEQTRQQKRQQTDDRERTKIMSHFKRAVSSSAPRVTASDATKPYEVVVEGVRFYVAKNGSKLVKVPGDNNSMNAVPKMAIIGGVKFYRSKNGNLYRHGIVKAQRQTGVVKKVDEPCRLFSTTGSVLISFPTHLALRFRRFSRLEHGSCSKGPRCRYIHDPAKVAICKDILAKGECPQGEDCDLSHELIPERTPSCLHFAKGNCTNSNCRYTHATSVSPGAPVCRPFGIYGYCDKGANCSERHVFECPDFSNTGVCRTKGCKLLHRERASVLRKRIGAGDGDQQMEDVSSDDDGESVDSNDVDSDEVEEFIGEDDGPDLDFATQKDFIEL